MRKQTTDNSQNRQNTRFVVCETDSVESMNPVLKEKVSRTITSDRKIKEQNDIICGNYLFSRVGGYSTPRNEILVN
jgi:hypothetical protein